MKRLLLIALSSLPLGACGSDCLKLAQQICDCQPTASQRDTCNTDASNQKALITITSQQEAACTAALNTCDCRLLNTPEGKVACGQARNP